MTGLRIELQLFVSPVHKLCFTWEFRTPHQLTVWEGTHLLQFSETRFSREAEWFPKICLLPLFPQLSFGLFCFVFLWRHRITTSKSFFSFGQIGLRLPYCLGSSVGTCQDNNAFLSPFHIPHILGCCFDSLAWAVQVLQLNNRCLWYLPEWMVYSSLLLPRWFCLRLLKFLWVKAVNCCQQESRERWERSATWYQCGTGTFRKETAISSVSLLFASLAVSRHINFG